MIYNTKLQDKYCRNEVIEYIQSKKKEGLFRVIDVGGAVSGWSAPYIDALVDINPPNNNTNFLYFQCDITDANSWKEIDKYVEENGKFDLCICTHTLEDIINPRFVCNKMSKISKEGYIAVPSKYIELTRQEGQYRGYIHHRWIFVVRNDRFIGYPKINYIEYINAEPYIQDKSHYLEFSFFWKDEIKVDYLNNNYLGPSVSAVIEYYKTIFDRDDYD